MKRRLPWVPLVSVAVAAAAIGVGVWVHLERQRTRVASDTITRRAEELAPGAQQLIPGLQDAYMVAIDRPHDPRDLAQDGPKSFKRRREFKVTTNRWGTRGADFVVPAPGFRVLAVGDSVTFGWGVQDNETWPVKLSSLLGLEVINCGWPSAGADHLFRWIRQHARRLDADLVIYAQRPQPHGGNLRHWAQQLRLVARAIKPTRLAVVLAPVSTFDPVGIRRWQQEYDFARRNLGGLPLLELTPAFREALPLPGVRAELGPKVQRLVRMPDNTVLLEAPTPGQDRLARKITDAFEADPKMHEPLFFDGGHTDAAGCALFAREVARWLRQKELVPAVK